MSQRVREESYSLRGRVANQVVGGSLLGGLRYFDGPLLFPEGIVVVMSEEPDPDRFDGKGYTRFDAVVSGRQYIRTEYRAMTRRGVVTVAHRWLKGLIARGGTDGE